MWQHCDNHAISGVHKTVDMLSGDSYDVTSTHHQMMFPNKNDGGMLVVAISRESTFREKMGQLKGAVTEPIALLTPTPQDVEAIWYERNQCFCFQPHPEFTGYTELKDRYFDYINTYLEP